MIVSEFSNLFDNLNAPVMVCADDTVIYCNPALIESFGDFTNCKKQELFIDSDTVSLNGTSYNVTATTAFDHDIYYLASHNPSDDILYHASTRLKNKIAELKLYEKLLSPTFENMDDEKLLSYFSSLSKSIAVLHRMVGNLGYFQSFDKSAFLPVTFNFAQIIGDIADSIPVFVGENCPKIIFECASGDMTVQADKNKIEFALFQLLSNGLKHTEKEDKITIRLIKNTDSYTVIVTDTGSGMSEKQLSSAWLPGNSELTPTGGIGLGLPIVAHIAAMHGGHALISSNTSGTTVSITIPALQENADNFTTLSAQYDNGLSDLMLQLSDVIPAKHFRGKFTD